MLKSLDLRIFFLTVRLLAYILIAKIPGAFKEIMVASTYGVSSIVDSYNLAYSIVTLAPSLLFSCLFGAILPYAASLESVSKKDKRDFLKQLNFIGCVIGIAIFVLNYALAPAIVDLFVTFDSSNRRIIAVEMMRWLAPLSISTMIVAVGTIQLCTVNMHSYALMEGMPALVMMCVLYFSQSSSQIVLVYSSLLGSFLQMIGIGGLIYASRNPGLSLKFSFRLDVVKWKSVFNSLGVLLISQICMSMSVPIDQFFAGHLESGSIAILGYANRIISLYSSLVATVISRVTTPIFSEFASDGNTKKNYRQAIFYSIATFLISLLIASVTSIYSIQIVSIFFGRGLFSISDVKSVADALEIGIWTLPFYAAGNGVMVAFLTSERKYRKVLTGSIIAVLIKVAIILVYYKTIFIKSIMFGNVGMYLSSFILYSLWVNKYGNHKD